MGNSAGVRAQPQPNSPAESGDLADNRQTPTDQDQIDYDQIPIDYSESPTNSGMSGRISQISRSANGSSMKESRNNLSRHARFLRRHNWYSDRRAWPRASERDRQFGYAPSNTPKHGCMGQEAVMPNIDNRQLQSGLHVTEVDLHLEENTETHHTNMYQCTGSRRCHPTRKKAELVIRRGEEFIMTLKFSQRCDLRKNDVTLYFNLGDDFKPNNNLNATVKVDYKGDNSYIPKKWGATCVSQDGRSLTLAIYVPASTPVGEWELSVTTVVDVKNGKNVIWQYNHNEDINIIFNPWCKADWVYQDDDKWRNETVLNDSGVYFHGSCFRMAASPWFYGQFEDGVLEAAFHLLRKGCDFQTTPSMANPAFVTSTLAETINTDEHGVIMGEWTGDYTDGTAPTKWKGSDKIIRQYMSTGKPVRYGQCWVFAGLLSTLCRSLGIPSRCVTNYSSGHNTDTANLSIDYFHVRNDRGDWMEVSDDSIWSFHVWSEVWMKRPDLNAQQKYDGWQAVDPTPLQHSDGLYCSVLCPVTAIKNGELGVDKDMAFMFGLVNADKVIWREDPESGKLVETKRLRSLVGKMISTHEPTGRPYRGASMKTYGGKQKLERHDVTSAYKYEEGSNRERMVVQKAEKAFRLANGSLKNCHNDDVTDHDVDPTDDIRIEIAEIGDVFVGSGFQFKVHVHNTGSHNRSVGHVVLKVFYKTYFGANNGLAAFKKFGGFHLGPKERETIKIDVSSNLAAARPQDGFHFELQAVAELRDRDYVIIETMPFLLRRPNIRLKGPSVCCPTDEIEVEVTFSNPLSVPLTQCEVDIEGSLSCLDPTEDNFTIPDIKPLGEWRTVLFLKPKLHPSGKKLRDLSLVLESSELRDIIGYYAVTVD